MNKKLRREHKINQEIVCEKIRLVGEGIVSNVYPLTEAIAIAQSKEMDLVLINETSIPPVAKVMKYEKYLYEQSKKPKQKRLDLKEIKVSLNIGEHDLSYRTKQIIEFLKEGRKVKISLKFKGREITFINAGKELLLKLAVAVEEYGIAESLPNLEGKQMFIVIRGKTKNN